MPSKEFPRVQPITYSFEGAKCRNMEYIAKAEHLKTALGTVVDGVDAAFKKKLADNQGNPWSTMYYSEELFKLAAQHKMLSYVLHIVSHIESEQQKLNTEIILDVTLEFLQHHVDNNFRYTSCTERGSSGMADAHLVAAVREFTRGSSWDAGVWWRDAQRRDAEYQVWENERYGHAATESKKQLDAKKIEREAAETKSREARRAVKQKIKRMAAMDSWKELTDEEVLAGWPLGSNSRIWEVRQVHSRIEAAQQQARRAEREAKWALESAARQKRDDEETEAKRINEVASKP